MFANRVVAAMPGKPDLSMRTWLILCAVFGAAVIVAILYAVL